MLITSTTNPYAATAASTGMSQAAIKRSDDAFLKMFEVKERDPAEELREITRGGVAGMMAWKIEQMQKEAAEKSLAARGMTIDDVKAMPAEERVALQQTIMNEVAEMVKKAVEEDMKQKQAEVLRKSEQSAQAEARGGLDFFA